MSDLKLGILLWSQAASWPEMLDAAKRVDRLGYDHLWTWDHLYAIFGDPYQPIFEGWSLLNAWARETERTRLGLLVGANTFRNPGLVAKTVDDARPRQRRPGDPRHRRRLDGARAPRPRHRVRERLRPAARLARRIGRGDATRARWRVGDLGAGRPLRVRRPAPQPAAGPEAPADHDRRQRREEDPPDGRPLRRHVERDGSARPDGPQDRRPPRALRRRRARHRRDRVHARDQGHDPRHRGRGGSRSGRPRWRTTRRRWPTSRTTPRSGTAPPSSSPTGCDPYVELGFRTVISEQPAPYDVETLERLIGEVMPLL